MSLQHPGTAAVPEDTEIIVIYAVPLWSGCFGPQKYQGRGRMVTIIFSKKMYAVSGTHYKCSLAVLLCDRPLGNSDSY